MPLDPAIARFLEEQKNQPSRSSLTVEETRAFLLALSRFAEKSPPLPRVDDIHTPVRIRQYWPADDASLPIVVFFHGGRFFSGSLDTHDSMCRFLALFSGARIAAVDYRLAPEHPYPAAAEDAQSAVDWALSQGVPVGVAGDSAGAALAAGAAARPDVRCQVLLYPMLDPACSTASHQDFAIGFGPGSADMKRGWNLYLGEGKTWSPSKATCPTLVITAEYDCLRDEGEAYARSVGADLHRYDGVIHGFGALTDFLPQGRAALVEAGEYLYARLHMGE